MKKLLSALIIAITASAFTMATPVISFAADEQRKEVDKRIELNSATVDELVTSGAAGKELAQKIVELREQLGSFQNYDDLKELNIPADQLEKLQFNTTIQGIAADCTC